MTQPTRKPIRIPSAKSEDQPATRKMLRLVRDELKSDIRGVKEDIKGIKSDIDSIKSDLNSVKSDLASVKSDVTSLKVDMADIKSSNLRMQFLLEEQNANNRIVLEGLQILWQRQDALELRK